MRPICTYSADGYFYYPPEKQVISVLLIEDTRSDVILINRMLRDPENPGLYQITDVPRMVEALELLDKRTFDIVLLDLDLLDIDGIATVSALRAENPDIPIIVFSANNDPGIKEQALMCGAKHFLRKGLESATSLKKVIEESLNLQHS